MRETHDRIRAVYRKTLAWNRATGEPETIESYFARGGTVTQCPTVTVYGPCISQLSMNGKGTRRPAMA